MASRTPLSALLRSFPRRPLPTTRLAFPLASPSHQSHLQPRPSSTRASSSSTSSPTADSVEPPDYLDERERHIFTLIKEQLQPTSLEVQDISGGCGSMYALDIVSAKFAGLPVIKQHRLVNQVLGEEIKSWHGVQLKTKAP